MGVPKKFLHLSRALLVLLCLFALPAAAAGIPWSLAQWLFHEQNRIDRTVDSSLIIPPDVKSQETRYRPESGNWFELRSVWIPERELEIAKLDALIPEALRPELIKTVEGKSYYRLFIHPESTAFYRELLSKYPTVAEHEATSTASSRSLLVRSRANPELSFFAKISLDVELGGVVRTIPRGEVVRSVGTTAYLFETKPGLSPVFEFLPEVLGIIPKKWARGGQLIRLIPENVRTGKSTLVPLFSLYARPDGKGESLLESLVRSAQTEAPVQPAVYVHEQILKPFLNAWADWAIHGSVVMEAHAQNVLLELDAAGRPTGRFFHRDMGGFNINASSPLFNKEIVEKLPTFGDFREEYHQKSSVDARVLSLKTYFVGGFLYNIDRELARLDPGYKSGSIYDVFWSEAGLAIQAASGMSSTETRPARLRERMDTVLERAQKLLLENARATPADCERTLTSRFWRFVRRR